MTLTMRLQGRSRRVVDTHVEWRTPVWHCLAVGPVMVSPAIDWSELAACWRPEMKRTASGEYTLTITAVDHEAGVVTAEARS